MRYAPLVLPVHWTVPMKREGKPVRAPRPDGIYPRCVCCGGENYMPLVLAYSAGSVPCASTTACGRYLPGNYPHYKWKEEK